jgi:hypothetical protein
LNARVMESPRAAIEFGYPTSVGGGVLGAPARRRTPTAMLLIVRLALTKRRIRVWRTAGDDVRHSALPLS